MWEPDPTVLLHGAARGLPLSAGSCALAARVSHFALRIQPPKKWVFRSFDWTPRLRFRTVAFRESGRPVDGVRRSAWAAWRIRNKLRRDGFASMQPRHAGGLLKTRAVTFAGRHMFINVDMAGAELCAWSFLLSRSEQKKRS